jgi:hypothetical protein
LKASVCPAGTVETLGTGWALLHAVVGWITAPAVGEVNVDVAPCEDAATVGVFELELLADPARELVAPGDDDVEGEGDAVSLWLPPQPARTADSAHRPAVRPRVALGVMDQVCHKCVKVCVATVVVP